MSELRVDKLSPQSGTEMTLGDNLDDFLLPSGAEIKAKSGSTITIESGATLANAGTATGFASGFTMGTVFPTTSGTNNTWTGIPSGTTNIILSMHNAYNSGGVELKVQLGDSGGIETTSYKSYLLKITGSTIADSDTTDSFKFPAADHGHSGHMQFTLVDSSTNTWSCTAAFRVANNVISLHAGSKILSGELTQIKASLSSGAWSGANGYINIQYS